MTRCLDEARLQSYFDGELSIELMESVTSHLASCATCAAAARELEEESALLMTALSAEFEASVPTERLRQRIDAAVSGDRYAAAQTTEKSTGLSGFLAGLFDFGTQRALGYASLAVVLAFAAILGIVKMKSTAGPAELAGTQPPVVNKGDDRVAVAPPKESPSIPAIQTTAPPKQGSNLNPRPIKVSASSSAVKPAPPVKLIPGERSYLQAIARLDSTIKSNKKAMRPSLQVEYERNLAVVDRAIVATRSAAKSNPNDPDAADFMFAAYQSKVDLLNTIADARLGGGRGH
jgi:hypothetical protein